MFHQAFASRAQNRGRVVVDNEDCKDNMTWQHSGTSLDLFTRLKEGSEKKAISVVH